MVKNILMWLLSSIALTCYSQNEMELNTNDIISKIVDTYALPVPPLPKDSITSTISDHVLDSLKSVKLKVAIFPLMTPLESIKEKMELPKNYSVLLSKKLKNKEININALSSRKGHHIILADSLELRKTMDFPNFDLLFEFSRIYFNENYTEAVLELGISRSRLAGYSALYGLKKENGEWIVDYKKGLTIW